MFTIDFLSGWTWFSSYSVISYTKAQ